MTVVVPGIHDCYPRWILLGTFIGYVLHILGIRKQINCNCESRQFAIDGYCRRLALRAGLRQSTLVELEPVNTDGSE